MYGSVSLSIPETGWATWFDFGTSKKQGGVEAIKIMNIIKYPVWILFWGNPCMGMYDITSSQLRGAWGRGYMCVMPFVTMNKVIMAPYFKCVQT